jgi:hypothetical protein
MITEVQEGFSFHETIDLRNNIAIVFFIRLESIGGDAKDTSRHST